MSTARATLLQQYLATAPAFDWAAHHCGHFAARWVALATGRPAPQMPPVDTPRTAWRAVQRLGGPAAACARVLGLQPLAVPLAAVGDLVLLPLGRSGRRGALGICAGRMAMFLNLRGHVEALPALQASHAWRVPA